VERRRTDDDEMTGPWEDVSKCTAK
jgi:hypothetical protein